MLEKLEKRIKTITDRLLKKTTLIIVSIKKTMMLKMIRIKKRFS